MATKFNVQDTVRLKSTGRTGVVVKTPDERSDNCIVDYDKGDWDYVHPDDLDLIEATAAAPSETTAKFAVGDAVVWPQIPAYKMVIHMRAVNNEGWIVRPETDEEELNLYRGYAADGELSAYEGSNLQWQLEGREMYAKLQAELDTLREKNAALVATINEIGEAAAMGQGDWLTVQEGYAPGWTAPYKRINDLCDAAIEAAKGASDV